MEKERRGENVKETKKVLGDMKLRTREESFEVPRTERYKWVDIREEKGEGA